MDKPFHGQNLPLKHWMEEQLIKLFKFSKPIIIFLGKKCLTTQEMAQIKRTNYDEKKIKIQNYISKLFQHL